MVRWDGVRCRSVRARSRCPRTTEDLYRIFQTAARRTPGGELTRSETRGYPKCSRTSRPGPAKLAAGLQGLQDNAVTLRAVKRANEILGDDLCSTCPRRQEREQDWYSMI